MSIATIDFPMHQDYNETTMASEVLKIAMGQMRVDGGLPEDNLNGAAFMIMAAAQEHCQAIVLPECLDLGWTHDSALKLAQPVPGPHSDRLAHLAREHGIHIVVGLVEREGDDLYNSAILIDDQGDILLKHRKINELDFAQELYCTGTTLNCVDTILGRVAIPICADNLAEAQHIGDTLGLMGVDLILSPCAWAVPPKYNQKKKPYGQEWIKPYTRLAKKYGMAVIGVSNVGTLETGDWAGWNCIGCSLAVGRNGKILEHAPYGEEAEGMFIVTLSLA